MSLPQHNRLRSNRDFSRVHRKGKRAATRHLAIRALRYHTPTLVSQTSASQDSNSQRSNSHRSNERVSRRVRAHGDREISEGVKWRSPRLSHRPRADGPPFVLSSSRGATAPTTRAIGPRFGISISRKVSKRAVVRNRIKRQLKAIIRDRFLTIAPTWQIVIVVRPPAVECSFADFLRELEYLLQKLAVVKH